MTYYTGIIIITWATLLGLSILVFENDRFLKKDKKSLYLTYAVIAFAALAEWLGVLFNGNTEIPVWLLRLVKCIDYILTPIAGVMFITQMYRSGILQKITTAALGVNAVFQITCFFTGWMTIIDQNNVYSHGPLYVVYVGIYMLTIAIVVVGLVIYGKNFKRQNIASLIFIVALVTAGIMTQEFSGGEIRISYLSLAIGAVMLFIRNAEFHQLQTDESLNMQRVKLMLSQIQPHFIYNSLSSISELCETDPKGAQKLTDDFAEYLKYNFAALTDERLLPFEKQLEQVGFYLNIEKARFGDRIKVVYDIQTKNFYLPTLTVQPIVENAVKHGLCKKDGGGTITLRSYENESEYVIEIIDDGIGFDTNVKNNASRTNIGIENVRARLAYVGSELQVQSQINVGTTVKIKVPKIFRGGGE